MICTSFGQINRAFHPDLLDGLECAEIRLDLLSLSAAMVKKTFSRPQTLIATCRPGTMSDERRISLLSAALEAGAAYIDLDFHETESIQAPLISLARERGCRLILSYHNHNFTPKLPFLRKKVADCLQAGADLVKIACLVKEPAEAARLVALYDLCRARPGSLLAIGMGAAGSWTRIAALLLGAPFSYASPDDLKATAPGQMSTSLMARLLGMLAPEPAT